MDMEFPQKPGTDRPGGLWEFLISRITDCCSDTAKDDKTQLQNE